MVCTAVGQVNKTGSFHVCKCGEVMPQPESVPRTRECVKEGKSSAKAVLRNTRPVYGSILWTVWYQNVRQSCTHRVKEIKQSPFVYANVVRSHSNLRLFPEQENA